MLNTVNTVHFDSNFERNKKATSRRKYTEPVHHHSGEFPIANDLVALIRLFHAVCDESQFLEYRVQFLLHPAEWQRCRCIFDRCWPSGRYWRTER